MPIKIYKAFSLNKIPIKFTVKFQRGDRTVVQLALRMATFAWKFIKPLPIKQTTKDPANVLLNILVKAPP